MVTGYIGMIIAVTGLSTMSTTIAAYRERGILRRLSATPLDPFAVVGAQMAAQLGITVLGGALLMVAGILSYGLELPRMPLVVVLGLALDILSMFAVGFVIAALVRTLRATQAVGQALLFPMIFLSGATFFREDMPGQFSVRVISYLSPM